MATKRVIAAFAVVVSACATPGSLPGGGSVPVAGADRQGRPNAQALPAWAKGAVFYEVFVRSFQDSDGDGVGDLKGLIDRLDYLNDGDPRTDTDLGVDALWLMPVFASPSYHGYDTTDYDHINPAYGDNAAFERLCQEAHRRGMRVIVDLVLNHSSNQHPWFLDSASGPTSPKRDWYTWRADNPGWGQPWNAAGTTWHKKNGAFYYSLFWEGMPDLNLRNPAVTAELSRVALSWLARGADGFRLDATRHLFENGPGDALVDQPETHAWLKDFAARVRAARPDAVLVGENWTDTPIIARYFGDTSVLGGGDELPLNFDFPLAQRIIAAARQGEASLVAGKIDEMNKVYPAGVTWTPFLTNHDMQRIASNLKSDGARLRTAAAVLLTLPGTPFLYYGEEIGLENGPGGEDEWKRTPMPWDGSAQSGFTSGKPWHAFAPGRETTHVAAQAKDPRSLLSHYKGLIRARHASNALQHGPLKLLSTEGAVLAWRAGGGGGGGDRSVLVAHNLGDEPAKAELPLDGARLGATLMASEPVQVETAGSVVRMTLPPHASVVWWLEQ